MDKIIKIIIVSLILNSCSKKQEFSIKKNKIIFVYEQYIIIDLQTGNFLIKYYGLKHKSRIHLSDQEKLAIISSFNENNMGEKIDEIWCTDENDIGFWYDKIQIYYDNKIQSMLNVNWNYAIKSSIWHNQEYRIVSFRNDIKKVLENNSDFKRALDTLNKFQKQKKALFL